MQFGSVGDKVEATFNPEWQENWITECKIKSKPVFVTEYKRSIWSLTLTFAMNQPKTIKILLLQTFIFITMFPILS